MKWPIFILYARARCSWLLSLLAKKMDSSEVSIVFWYPRKNTSDSQNNSVESPQLVGHHLTHQLIHCFGDKAKNCSTATSRLPCLAIWIGDVQHIKLRCVILFAANNFQQTRITIAAPLFSISWQRYTISFLLVIRCFIDKDARKPWFICQVAKDTTGVETNLVVH